MVLRKPRPARPGSATVRGEPSVRDRLLDTAANLFYQEGARAVGVDLVVERSGVAKTTLYRHFSTKDDLIAAVLERDDVDYWNDWGTIAQQHPDDARAELEAHLKWIAQYIGRAEYRGCPFINIATDFPAADHPARAVATRHKTQLRGRVRALTRRMGVRRADELADQLVLLIDGAYVNGQLLGKKGPAHSLVAAGLALIAVANGGK
jgi:AcrR family transcriptional regulator